MSVFQIRLENGLSRILETKDSIETPVLISTGSESQEPTIKFNHVYLSDRGIIEIPDLDDITNESFIDYQNCIANWSIVMPRLLQGDIKLAESYEKELSLFLERIKKYELPEAFGLVYNPLMDPPSYLRELLILNPSVIIIQIGNIEDIPANKLLDTIIDCRRRIPPNIALYLPGGAPIGYLGLLVGLGIDIVDDNSAYRAASRDFSFFDGFYRRAEENYNRYMLINENIIELQKEFVAIKRSLVKNNLWSRITRDMHSSPSMASLVKTFLTQYLPQISSSRYSSLQTNKIKFTGDEDLYHPDVLKYYQQLLATYQMSSEKKLIILLPCSAKKPYRESRSHRIFEKTIKKAAKNNYGRIEIWSLTSPIGVVPRDLETIYPAGFYDIPVTGDWSEEEVKITGDLLQSLLQGIPDTVGVLVHVSGDYEKMINYALSGKDYITSWIEKRPTSNEAQINLKNSIQKYFEPQENEIKKLGNKVFHKATDLEINNLVRYMHGKDCQIDLANVKSFGRPPKPIQFKASNNHFLSWDVINGKINLAPESAIQIVHTTDNWILTDTNELIGSTLFSIGIIEASEKISPDDEILIFNADKSKLLGIGQARISGYSMNRLEYGIAAKIKKKCNLEVPNHV